MITRNHRGPAVPLLKAGAQTASRAPRSQDAEGGAPASPGGSADKQNEPIAHGVSSVLQWEEALPPAVTRGA